MNSRFRHRELWVLPIRFCPSIFPILSSAIWASLVRGPAEVSCGVAHHIWWWSSFGAVAVFWNWESHPGRLSYRRSESLPTTYHAAKAIGEDAIPRATAYIESLNCQRCCFVSSYNGIRCEAMTRASSMMIVSRYHENRDCYGPLAGRSPRIHHHYVSEYISRQAQQNEPFWRISPKTASNYPYYQGSFIPY